MRKPTYAVFAVALVLTACGRAPSPSPAPTLAPQVRPTETQVVKPTPAAPDVTITIWEQEDELGRSTVLYPLIDEFMKANPHILVTAQSYRTEELRIQFLAAAGAGAEPDVVRGPNDLVGNFASAGLLMPVDEVFDEQVLGAFLPGMLAGGTVSGTLYGLPDRCGGHLMLVYNRRLVPAPPNTTDELLAMAQQATDEAAGTWGLVYNTREPFWLAPWLAGFGGAVLEPATDQPRLDTGAMVKALQFLHGLNVTSEVVPPGCDYEMARSLFASGNAGMVIDGDWSLQGYVQQGLDVGVAPLPQVTETGLWPAPLVEARYFMVSRRLVAGTAEAEAVRLFVEFMTGEHAQRAWVETTRRLPTNKMVADSPLIQNDALMAGMVAQLKHAVGRPASPLLSCFWDSTYSSLQEVLGGTLTPEDAAQEMQRKADQCTQMESRQ